MVRSLKLNNLSIPIMGKPCQIIVKSLDGNEGEFIASEFKIYMCKSLTDPTRQLQTLCHELGHALMERIGMRGMLDSITEEILVENFANLFLEIFVIDPDDLETYRHK